MIQYMTNGRFGNNLFCYLFARILHEETGIKMQWIPKGMPFENREHFPHAIDCDGSVLDNCVYFHDESNADDILNKALSIIIKEKKGLILNGYFQNWKYYWPYRDKIKEWLKLDRQATISKHDWVMHFRREDYLESGSQLSLNYYEKILNTYAQDRKGKLYLIGKDIEEDIQKHFIDKYDAIYLKLTSINSFAAIVAGNNLIGSNSTFFWIASFLSDAEKVFVPLPARGYWSKSQTQQLLIPLEYGFHTIIEDDNNIC